MGNGEQITLIIAFIEILFLIGGLVLWIFFLRTQYRILLSLQPVNRQLAPGLVWLQLIPVFALVWQFFVIFRLAVSVRKERISRLEESLMSNTLPPSLPASNYPGVAAGLGYCILMVTYTVGYTAYDLYVMFRSKPTDLDSASISNVHYTGVSLYVMIWLQLATIVAGLACWISYWINLTRIRRQLTRQSPTPSSNAI